VCEALPVAYFARISYFYVSRALSMDLLLVQLPDCYSCVEKKQASKISSFVGSIRDTWNMGIACSRRAHRQ
jgi:hypothetical protein